MRGPNAEYFKPSAFETLLTSAYTIAPASDRMGLRLQGAALEHAIEGELPSQGTTAGGLQVPSGGQPILLLADRQTTGGYPRIATVIAADIAAAGRLAAGMSIRFQDVSREEAVQLLKTQRQWLASLPSLLQPVAEAFSAERLLSSQSHRRRYRRRGRRLIQLHARRPETPKALSGIVTNPAAELVTIPDKR